MSDPTRTINPPTPRIRRAGRTAAAVIAQYIQDLSSAAAGSTLPSTER